jgi:hypothetical protein
MADTERVAGILTDSLPTFALSASRFRFDDLGSAYPRGHAASVPGGHFGAGYYGFREIDSKPAPIAV